METKVINSPKAIMNALTITFENYKHIVIELMQKYINLPRKIANDDLFDIYMNLLSNNLDFANDIAILMDKTQELRNASGHRNFLGAILGAVSAISGVATSYMDSKSAPAKQEHDIAMEQMKLQREQLRIQAEATAAKNKQKTTIIIAGTSIFIATIGLIIYLKTRK